MIVSCLAVIGILCVSQTANLDAFTVKHDETGLYGAVTLSAEGWEVGQTLHSDCIDCGPDKKLFSKACDGDVCISYHRTCDDPDHPTMCEYYFDGYPPIDVLAKSETYFRAIVDCIGVKTPKGGILLSALSIEAPGPRRGPPMKNYLRSPPAGGGTP